MIRVRKPAPWVACLATVVALSGVAAAQQQANFKVETQTITKELVQNHQFSEAIGWGWCANKRDTLILSFEPDNRFHIRPQTGRPTEIAAFPQSSIGVSDSKKANATLKIYTVYIETEIQVDLSWTLSTTETGIIGWFVGLFDSTKPATYANHWSVFTDYCGRK